MGSIIIGRPGVWLSGGGGGLAGGGGIEWLLRDDFTTAEAAPLASPRTAEPGPGTLTLVQTDGEFSISSAKLNFPTQTTAAYGDQGFYGASQSRLAGRTALSRVNVTTTNNGLIGACEWYTSTTINHASEHGFFLASFATARQAGNSVANVSISTGVAYDLAVVLRGAGAFYFIKGGAYTSWTLVWVEVAGSTGTLYPAFSNYDAVGTLDTFRVLDLPAPFATDYGLATARTASPSANDTITSEANAVIEHTWTAVTGETLELSTRRTTDNDRWIIRGDQGGSTVKLIEVVAGAETERGSAAQTWTNTTAYRVVVVQDSTTIRVYVANVLKITYSSASSNSTATGVKTNKAGTDLVAWPRTLTGAAAAILDSAVA